MYIVDHTSRATQRNPEFILRVDDREPKDTVRHLRTIRDNFKWQKVEIVSERLDVGDFVSSNGVIIERKTANDFYASFVEKHSSRTLDKQFDHMLEYKKSGYYPLLFLRGRLSSLPIEERTLKSLNSKKTKFAMAGISVLEFDTEIELLRCILKACQYGPNHKPEHKPVVIKAPGEDKTLSMYMNLTGVAHKKAILLYRSFPTMTELCSASKIQITLALMNPKPTNATKVKISKLAESIWKELHFSDDKSYLRYKAERKLQKIVGTHSRARKPTRSRK